MHWSFCQKKVEINDLAFCFSFLCQSRDSLGGEGQLELEQAEKSWDMNLDFAPN